MTSTTLKMIALALMFLDHIRTFISGTPLWLKWIGRISAPLFLFTMVWGLHYTRDRKKYLKNMYFWGIGMSLGDALITLLVPNAHQAPTNNIFVTLFLVGFIATMIEKWLKKETKSANIMLGLLVVVQVAGFLLIPVITSLIPGMPTAYLMLVALLPNLLHCEGTMFLVLVGVVLYFCKRLPPVRLALVYLLLSVMMTLSQELTFTFKGLFEENYQWMMIGALPFILLYNGQKGKNFKWLFYIFYPAHIYLLSWVGSWLRF